MDSSRERARPVPLLAHYTDRAVGPGAVFGGEFHSIDRYSGEVTGWSCLGGEMPYPNLFGNYPGYFCRPDILSVDIFTSGRDYLKRRTIELYRQNKIIPESPPGVL